MNHRHSILPSRPLIPSHPDPFPPRPLLSPSLYFSSRLSSPTYVSSLSYVLHSLASAHLSLLLEPLHLCQSSRGGFRVLGRTSLSPFPHLLFRSSAEILITMSINVLYVRRSSKRNHAQLSGPVETQALNYSRNYLYRRVCTEESRHRFRPHLHCTIFHI